MFVPVYQPLPPVWDGVESVLLHHRWSLSRCTLRLRLACPWKPVHCTGLACFSRPKHCKHQQSHKGKHFLPLPGPDFLHVSTNHKMITNCKCFIKEQHDGIWIPLVGSWDRPSSLHQRDGGARESLATGKKNMLSLFFPPKSDVQPPKIDFYPPWPPEKWCWSEPKWTKMINHQDLAAGGVPSLPAGLASLALTNSTEGSD